MRDAFTIIEEPNYDRDFVMKISDFLNKDTCINVTVLNKKNEFKMYCVYEITSSSSTAISVADIGDLLHFVMWSMHEVFVDALVLIHLKRFSSSI